jgi:hypothetical protein
MRSFRIRDVFTGGRPLDEFTVDPLSRFERLR